MKLPKKETNEESKQREKKPIKTIAKIPLRFLDILDSEQNEENNCEKTCKMIAKLAIEIPSQSR